MNRCDLSLPVVVMALIDFVPAAYFQVEPEAVAALRVANRCGRRPWLSRFASSLRRHFLCAKIDDGGSLVSLVW